ncbi:MAG TPA: hypothetical protein VK165_12955 [Azonexus sp.]|nr:hypothetical protein [Azonexus sp.]
MNPESKVLSDFTRFLAHMPIKGDAALSILKGHLLIEELIWQLICQKVEHPDALKVRFSFEQQVCLARALVRERANGWEWEAASALNKIRNQLAHRLQPHDLEAKLNSFCSLVEANCSPITPDMDSLVGRLHWFIGQLYISLSARLHIKPKTLLEMHGEELKAALNLSHTDKENSHGQT